jgi:hypothetical protein
VKIGIASQQSGEPGMQASLIELEMKMPLFVFDLSDRTDVLASTEKAIMEEFKKNPVPRKSNISAFFISSYRSHKENEFFSPLIELTLQCISEIVKGHYEYNKEANYVCSNCWGAIYKPGDSARAHHHFPFDFSAVCYLKVDEGSSPIVFGGGCEFRPKVGSLIVFSGTYEHQVPATDSERVVAAMNFERVKLNSEPAPQT